MLISKVSLLLSALCALQLESVVTAQEIVPVTTVAIMWGKGVRGAHGGAEVSPDTAGLEFVWTQDQFDEHLKKDFYVLYDDSDEFKEVRANISCHAEAKKPEVTEPTFWFNNPSGLSSLPYLTGSDANTARVYCLPEENTDIRDGKIIEIDSDKTLIT
ncbi:uncharacterized protein IL334_005705 [Kwoniella shivajii]|uniref:Ig-like domain-containing protein n=1 Tax=Kwoniella shivajii TaxID=564305 RepID=A0ABZ1D3W2_9TREE|nr:hypothetical protein IL334_005705 [Kwoniella shivajii]